MNKKFKLELVPLEIIKVVEHSIENNKPVLLIGETGTGKTSFIRHLAEKHKKDFIRVNLNGSSGTDEMIGKIIFEDDKTKWIDGILINAMRRGMWLLLDEINAATPEVLFALHSLLDDDRQILISEWRGEIVKPHADFRFFASMNPNYSGTKELNKALLSRFPTIINFDFPNLEREVEIIKIHTDFKDQKKLENYIKMAHELRFAYRSRNINSICSTRELIAFCQFLDSGLSEEDSFNFSILNKCEEDDKNLVLSLARMFINLPNTKTESKSFLAENLKLKERLDIYKKSHEAYQEISKEIDEGKKEFKSALKRKNTGDMELIVKDLIKAFLGKKALEYTSIKIKEIKKSNFGFG